MSRAYLDHAATTPMVSEAVAAMTRELTRVGNASSLHASGRAARRVVEESRETIAARLGARPAEVIFTSGGTEADNLAVKGGFLSRSGQGRVGIVVSSIEHPAVHDSVGWLGHDAAAKVDLVAVDRTGRIDLEQLDSLVGPATALVTVMWANNEVGTVQPVAEIAEIARRRGALVAQRCRPGGGPPAGRLRRQRSGPAELHRAQARWPGRRRARCWPAARSR